MSLGRGGGVYVGIEKRNGVFVGKFGDFRVRGIGCWVFLIKLKKCN